MQFVRRPAEAGWWGVSSTRYALLLIFASSRSADSSRTFVQQKVSGWVVQVQAFQPRAGTRRRARLAVAHGKATHGRGHPPRVPGARRAHGLARMRAAYAPELCAPLRVRAICAPPPRRRTRQRTRPTRGGDGARAARVGLGHDERLSAGGRRAAAFPCVRREGCLLIPGAAARARTVRKHGPACGGISRGLGLAPAAV